MPSRSLFTGFLGALLVASAGHVVVPPRDESPLRRKELRHPNLYYGNVFRPVPELPVDTARRLGADLGRLGVDPANAYFDPRTGRWGTLIVTQPLIPGTGVGNHLAWSDLGRPAPRGPEELEEAAWDAFRSYLEEHIAELRIAPDELGEPRVTTIGDHLLQIHVGRSIDGVPVRDTFVKAALNSGNLVLLGERNWGDVEVAMTPHISDDQAEAIVRDHLGEVPMERLLEPAWLEVMPVSGRPDQAGITLGDGLEHRLVWVLRPYIVGDRGSWEALVDAHDGELLAFQDRNRYVSRRVEGGIFPVSNDGQGADGQMQLGFPMPFADVALHGSDVVFTTNTGGNLPTGADDGAISTELAGPYVRMNDLCGSVDESATAGDLDLEGVPLPGTDCTVPPGHSPGDTNASRTGFYELNRLAEQARGYLDYPWLDRQLTANMNINQTCNAFWNGSTVNFYRQGNGCGNTGEIAAIFDHEWGHGLDHNDADLSISSPGEAIADIIAQNRLNESCTGRGFRTSSNCGGYGDPCIECSGVREADWAKRQSGTPHGIDWILTSIDSEGGGCQGLGGSPGPCGQETHCEGTIMAEAAWDLVHRDLQGFEGSPIDLEPNTALELGTRLSYHGSSNVSNWYQCDPGEETGDGCNADGGYLGFLTADDDNGSLEDGTPHMSAIFAAFDRHQIACPTPVVQDSGCPGGPTAAPANLDAVEFEEGAKLTWDPVPGASGYWIFRTEGVRGCAFGKTKVGETTSTEFMETGLRNDFELFYSVIAVGESSACASPMSTCLPVTPQTGPTGTLRGMVTNALTSAPVAGATIDVVGLTSRTTTSNADGSYQVSVPVVGTHDVTATHHRYESMTVSGVTVSEGETTTLDFALDPVPIAEVAPQATWFELPGGADASDQVSLGNTGARSLEWELTEGAPASAHGMSNRDPDLDEAITIPGFSIDAPAEGGQPVTFTLPAGTLTRGRVRGLRFAGTVTGVSDGPSAASDTCMIVEAPDGTTYGVGGLNGTVDGCGQNDWDFQGIDSADDGAYESSHEQVFDPAVHDLGEWTFTFVNDWSSTDAATITWSDVTVTLYKEPLPICDDVDDVPWLSAEPQSGSIPPEASDPIDIRVDTAGMLTGTYEAGVCVATNDPDAPVIVVPVTLTVTGGYAPLAMEVDSGSPASDGNGVFEPSELVDVAPTWRSHNAVPEDLTGVASDFDGPAGASYAISIGGADYGIVEPGVPGTCRETGICYYLELDAPSRPVRHWDAGFTETLSDETLRTWTLHIGDSFTDVPRSNPFYTSIETLLHSGITGGCTGTEYCPGGANSRSQMPVFMLKALEGPNYTPPACVEGDVPFDDVPFDGVFCPWIQELANRGIVAGCGDGNYCPGDSVTRAQMAIFLLKTLEGSNYTPPTCTNVFDDVPCPSLFADWIEDLAARGITGGCTATEYCPGDEVTRAQMAVFLTKAFGFMLYGP